MCLSWPSSAFLLACWINSSLQDSWSNNPLKFCLSSCSWLHPWLLLSYSTPILILSGNILPLLPLGTKQTGEVASEGELSLTTHSLLRVGERWERKKRQKGRKKEESEKREERKVKERRGEKEGGEGRREEEGRELEVVEELRCGPYRLPGAGITLAVEFRYFFHSRNISLPCFEAGRAGLTNSLAMKHLVPGSISA